MIPPIKEFFPDSFDEAIKDPLETESCQKALLLALDRFKKEGIEGWDSDTFQEVLKLGRIYRTLLEIDELRASGKMTHELALSFLKSRGLPFETALDLGWLDLASKVPARAFHADLPMIPMSQIDRLLALLSAFEIKFYEKDAGELGFDIVRALCEMGVDLQISADELYKDYQSILIPPEGRVDLPYDLSEVQKKQIHTLIYDRTSRFLSVYHHRGTRWVWESNKEIPEHWLFSANQKIGHAILTRLIDRVEFSIRSKGYFHERVPYSESFVGLRKALIYLMQQMNITLDEYNTFYNSMRLKKLFQEPDPFSDPHAPALSKEDLDSIETHREHFFDRYLHETSFDRRKAALGAWVRRYYLVSLGEAKEAKVL